MCTYTYTYEYMPEYLMYITLLAHTVGYAIVLLSLSLLLHYGTQQQVQQCTVILPHSRHCAAATLNVAKM